MKKKIAAGTLAGVVGLTGVALLGPTVANAQDETPGTGRLSVLKDALQSLVTDGTLTSAQADKVATTLDGTLPSRGGMRGHRGGGQGVGMMGPAAMAETLGISVDELRQGRQDGKTLAEIAADNGIAKDALIDKLVAAAEKRLDEAVADDRLTQAQADERKADLEERITDMVDRERTGPGGREDHGPGMHRGWGPAEVPPSDS